MEYCKYHPLKPAAWYCKACLTHVCDECTDESIYKDERRCFVCATRLESLGAAHTVEPFWRRLAEMFRYPLRKEVMILIVLTSVISAFFSVLPIVGVVTALMATGIFTKYSFQCLKETANGNLVAPGMEEAYRGGVILILKIIGLLILVVIGGGILAKFIGIGFVSFLAMLLLFAVPAFLINYALTESMLRALRPRSILSIISAVGMPYGILIGFMFLMGASVDVLSYLVVSDAQWITNTLQSMISNYYMVVVFHMLGYVVFQYQERLGFYARARTDETPQARSQQQKINAHISVAVKEGQYAKVASLYQTYLNSHADDMDMAERFFEFIFRTGNADLMQSYADRYLVLKLNKGYQDQLNRIFRQVRQVLPGFIPQDGKVCCELAEHYFKAGDYAAAVKLLNGIQKKSADVVLLIRAFMLMAKALDELKKTEQAEQCRLMVARLQRSG